MFVQTAGKDLSAPKSLRPKLEGALNVIETLIDEGHKILSLLKLQALSCDSISNTPNTIGRSPNERAQSTSEPPTVVFGRDEDLEMMRAMLRSPPHDETKCYSVIGIHGIPGSGKTTLAEYVCKHERDDGYFNLIMWIHVSQNFSLHTVLTEMLEQASDKDKVEISNLDKLQRKLEEELRGKMFFLVLDDVWQGEGTRRQQLNQLLCPMRAGLPGSKILVTTRNEHAARALGAHNLVAISDLDEKLFLTMFMHYALDGVQIRDQTLLRKYWLIGEKIAGKLGRSPLAASTVAGQLNRRLEVDFWISTMKSDLLNNQTVGALWWSYRQLQEPIKQCFTYCSMFPRRYALQRDELVHLWVAEGFVKPGNGVEDAEDVGNGYFHVLLSTSFIQLKVQSSGKEYFTIHDLLHDLAARVAGSDCFTIEKDRVGQIPRGVRHLFIDSYYDRVFIENILKLGTLRTLMMSSSARKMSIDEFESVIKSLKKLRVVHVRLQCFEMIPGSIGQLKHMRYLGMFGSPFINITLPRTFSMLYQLQKFSVPFATSLNCSCDKEMANLVNLRYMPCYSLNFPNIGRLTWLRTMNFFTVRKIRGYEIEQLKHLDNLRDNLCIQGLKNVDSKEEAGLAKLANKVYVTDLVLDWEDYGPEKPNLFLRKLGEPYFNSGLIPNPQEEILEALHPPFLVESLGIMNYKGSMYPSWLSGQQGTLKTLQCLKFSYCNGSNAPPNISELVCLCKLEISHCNWKSLPKNMERLIFLEELVIADCKNILSVPSLPLSLKKLRLEDWNGLHPSSCNCELLVNLRCLEILRCNWNCLPENIDCLTLLEELSIKQCKNILQLRRLPGSLKKLTIAFCDRTFMKSCCTVGHPNWQVIEQVLEKAIN